MCKHPSNLHLHHFIIQKSQFGSHATKLLQILYQMQDVQLQSSLCPKALPGSVSAADPTRRRGFCLLVDISFILAFLSSKSRFVAAVRHLSCDTQITYQISKKGN